VFEIGREAVDDVELAPRRAAFSGSCVTITTIVPLSFKSSSSCMTSRAICESRLPVGSSASNSFGSPAIARAMATRCC
jgi:hypothetical protein